MDRRAALSMHVECFVLHIHSPKGLSPTGVGPIVMVGQLLLVVAALLTMPSGPTPPAIVRTLGVGWVIVGIAFWATTLRIFLREFPRGQLIVTGPYRFTRHPLYASLIVFVIPGTALITGAWALLAAALGGVALAYPLTLSEEADLERTFGDEWLAYRAHTSWLFPWPRK